MWDLDTKQAWLACGGGEIYKLSWDGGKLLQNEDDRRGYHGRRHWQGGLGISEAHYARENRGATKSEVWMND